MPKAVEDKVQKSHAANRAKASPPYIKKYVRSSPCRAKIRLTRHRCDFARTFDVLVASPPDRQRFTLYHDVMTQRSGYFAAARSGRWNKDNPLKPTDLTEDDPQVFLDYLHTVHNNHVHVAGLELGDDALFEENAALDEAMAEQYDTTIDRVLYQQKTNALLKGLMHLYTLADMLIDHETTNMIIDATIRTVELTHVIPNEHAVAVICRSTASSDGMRNLITEYYVHHANSEYIANHNFPDEFMKDLAVAFLRNEETGFSKEFKPSEYNVEWVPSDGPHRFYSGPGMQGDKELSSDDDGSDHKQVE